MTDPRCGNDVLLLLLPKQEEVSGGTTNTILRNLEPDTVYSVAVVPVYPDVDGIREQEKGKTSESPIP